jgi:hypothetical protein
MKMKKKGIVQAFVLCQLVVFSAFLSSFAADAYEGYTFYASRRTAKLIDMDGNTLHEWTSSYNVGANAYLLRDGSVLWPGDDNQFQGGVLKSGRFQIINWDNEVTWNFSYWGSDFCPHHDIEPVYYTADDPKEVPNVLVISYVRQSSTMSDKVTEIKPTGATTGEVVWEWNAWDHRVDNGSGHPEALGANSGGGMGEWTHFNSVSYNRTLDQVAIDVKSFNEFIIVDHSTTIQEAAGSTGGTYGRGGDILYRWGNPGNYGASGSRQLSGQHGTAWIIGSFAFPGLTLPGEGNILVYDNQNGRAVEIALPGSGDGVYPLENGAAYGPSGFQWTAGLDDAEDHEGSVQRLPNGNTLICNQNNNAIEVDSEGNTVWQKDISSTRAYRYALNYPAPLAPEVAVSFSTKSIRDEFGVRNSVNRTTFIFSSFKTGELSVFSLCGKKVSSLIVAGNECVWNNSGIPRGQYLARLRTGKSIIVQRINIVR